MYARLDHLRARTARDLAEVRRAGPSGTHQNRSERDSFADHARAPAGPARGGRGPARLRPAGPAGRHPALHRPARALRRGADPAPASTGGRRPRARFYQATAASPQDVVRRRHLSTRGRRVVGVEDEVLDLDAMADEDRAGLAGEGALLAAVGAHRTGRMGDIVATIQAEQDRVIRSDLGGALVVQGGPGTGKTAVALHRAAYLLYTHRDRLARSGVLLVGPNPLFLRYIEQVLPSLGETGVVMSTAADLYPGVTGVDEPRAEVAAREGRPADGPGAVPGGARPAAAARRAAQAGRRGSDRRADRRGGGRGPGPGPAHPQAAQHGPRGLPARPAGPPGRASWPGPWASRPTPTTARTCSPTSGQRGRPARAQPGLDAAVADPGAGRPLRRPAAARVRRLAS